MRMATFFLGLTDTQSKPPNLCVQPLVFPTLLIRAAPPETRDRCPKKAVLSAEIGQTATLALEVLEQERERHQCGKRRTRQSQSLVDYSRKSRPRRKKNDHEVLCRIQRPQVECRIHHARLNPKPSQPNASSTAMPRKPSSGRSYQSMNASWRPQLSVKTTHARTRTSSCHQRLSTAIPDLPL